MSNQKVKVGDIVIAPKECAKWLTAGKEYTVIKLNNEDIDSEIFYIHTGKYELACLPTGCAHLNYNDWIIKSEQ